MSIYRCGILDLPAEIIEDIASYLSDLNVCRLTYVNSILYQYIWHYLTRRIGQVKPPISRDIHQIFHIYPQLHNHLIPTHQLYSLIQEYIRNEQVFHIAEIVHKGTEYMIQLLIMRACIEGNLDLVDIIYRYALKHRDDFVDELSKSNIFKVGAYRASKLGHTKVVQYLLRVYPEKKISKAMVYAACVGDDPDLAIQTIDRYPYQLPKITLKYACKGGRLSVINKVLGRISSTIDEPILHTIAEYSGYYKESSIIHMLLSHPLLDMSKRTYLVEICIRGAMDHDNIYILKYLLNEYDLDISIVRNMLHYTYLYDKPNILHLIARYISKDEYNYVIDITTLHDTLHGNQMW